MSNNPNNTTKPTHRLYVVVGSGKTAQWKEIGAAWKHNDGKGYTQRFFAYPAEGNVQMREITERTVGKAAE